MGLTVVIQPTWQQTGGWEQSHRGPRPHNGAAPDALEQTHGGKPQGSASTWGKIARNFASGSFGKHIFRRQLPLVVGHILANVEVLQELLRPTLSENSYVGDIR